MSSPLRLAISGSVLFFSSSACFAAPQSPITVPETPSSALPAPQKKKAPAVRVDVMSTRGELRLQVELHDADVVKVLGEVATKGNLQIVITSGVNGTINELLLSNASPEISLEKICGAAALDYKIQDGVWIISPPGTQLGQTNKPKIIDSLAFVDIGVEELLSFIATQFNVQIAIEKDVKAQISFIRLQNKTPRQAIEIIAQIANLKMQEAKDGTLVLSQGTSTITHSGAIKRPTPSHESTGPLPPYYLLNSEQGK